MERRDYKHKIIIALGTNYEHDANIDKALEMLRPRIDGIKVSRRIWTAPIGINSGRFMNMLLAGTCSMDFQELSDTTKSIERLCGRTDTGIANNIVNIDIDILKYDAMKFHEEDWDREYIITLMTEL